ncbi:MAG: hypothetical protein ABR498_07065 [Candidatus Dormibacteria bacterium]
MIRLTRTAPDQRSRAISATQTTPWTLSDFARLLRFEVPSFIAVVVCFVGARQADTWDAQLYWVVGGMAAMLLAGAGWTGWFLVGTRELRRRQRRLAALTSRIAMPPAADPFAADVTVTGRGMTHFHQPDCPLAQGRPVTAASADEHSAQGLTPCGVCLG